MKAKRQERGAAAVGEESEVANAHEAFWKQVLCFAKTLSAPEIGRFASTTA